MKKIQKITFKIDQDKAIYLGFNLNISMLPVKVTGHKDIYIEQIKYDNYYTNNSICRETIINNIKKELSNTPYKRTMNMLIIIPNKSRDILDKGIKLINHYEKLLNWNKTYTYNVNKILGKDQKLNVRYKKFSFILITIPNKWLYSPQLTSLYLMFLKIAEVGFKCKFKTHRELIDELNNFFTGKPKKLCNCNFKYVFYYKIKNSYKYWDIFINNLKILYKNRTRKFNYNIDKRLEKLYSNSNRRYNIHLDGMENLIMNKSYDKQLRKNFDNLLIKTIDLQKVLLKE